MFRAKTLAKVFRMEYLDGFAQRRKGANFWAAVSPFSRKTISRRLLKIHGIRNVSHKDAEKVFRMEEHDGFAQRREYLGIGKFFLEKNKKSSFIKNPWD